ncbi:hypothetical protein BDB01DRAFT_832772 [Pilobolus umbonatus]|nr:hypothetical protein BDB01DRAFT_832772 [Pilobolus umbonatus]
MEENHVHQNKEHITRRSSIDDYYEYRVYDRNLGNNYQPSLFNMDYAPCPVLMMSRHQGFEWNDELFVNGQRRKAGYDCHKSNSLQRGDDKVHGQHIESDTGVIHLILNEHDCDIWP